jgi:hypothetical protein
MQKVKTRVNKAAAGAGPFSIQETAALKTFGTTKKTFLVPLVMEYNMVLV